MSDAITIVKLPDQSTARMPKMSYLTKENGLLSWLLTYEQVPQAVAEALAGASITPIVFLMLVRHAPLRGTQPSTCRREGSIASISV